MTNDNDPLGMAGNYLDIDRHIQAYPYFYTHKEGYIVGKEGMSLRDYFAGQALIGFVSKAYPHVDNIKRETIAKYSYEQADAMLKVRETNA